MQYWFSTSTEEFTPSEMLEQAKAAERAGFDGLGTSDHFAPWFPDGQAAQAWVYLGALGQVTQSMIGTAVTPIVHHYHPGLVAQAFMSLEKLYVSAFGPESAQVAARYGDGLWTLGDPDQAPEIVEAYREACEEHGREP